MSKTSLTEEEMILLVLHGMHPNILFSEWINTYRRLFGEARTKEMLTGSGYSSSSTDIFCRWYRANEEKLDDSRNEV